MMQSMFSMILRDVDSHLHLNTPFSRCGLWMVHGITYTYVKGHYGHVPSYSEKSIVFQVHIPKDKYYGAIHVLWYIGNRLRHYILEECTKCTILV